jgi:hypothetical protein
MAASIEIDYALTGSHVSQSFTASGTYVQDAGMPAITCVLRQSSGGILSAGTMPAGYLNYAGPGTWKADFNLGSGASNLTLHATISDGTSDADDQPEITVDATPPLTLDVLPAPPPPPIARAMKTVTGTYDNSVIDFIVCVGAFYKAKKIDTIQDTAIATFPAAGSWTANLNFNGLPAGQKYGVIAIGINTKGRLVGRVARKRK